MGKYKSKDFREYVERLVKDTPNNMELGKQLRGFIHSITENGVDEWRIEQFNRNRLLKDQVKTIEEMEKVVDEIFNS